SGHGGNPNDYRDFEIPRPANRRIHCSAPWTLLSFAPDCVHLRVHGHRRSRLEFADGPLRCVEGPLDSMEARFASGKLVDLKTQNRGQIEVTVSEDGLIGQIAPPWNPEGIVWKTVFEKSGGIIGTAASTPS